MNETTTTGLTTELTLAEGDEIVFRKLGSSRWVAEYWRAAAGYPVAQAWISKPETTSGLPCIDWLNVMKRSRRGGFGSALLKAIANRWPDTVISDQYLRSFDSASLSRSPSADL